MSIQKLSTKFANGTFINNIKEFFNKINEIIDHLTGTSDYKIYTAVLNLDDYASQIILQNTLGGVIDWTTSDYNDYTGTLKGAFTDFGINKTVICELLNADKNSNNNLPETVKFYVVNEDTVAITNIFGGVFTGNTIIRITVFGPRKEIYKGL